MNRMDPSTPGRLFLVATPIGNLEDITIRALKTLFSVDTIACEDTRRTHLFLSALKERYGSIIKTVQPNSPQLISYYDEVEQQKTPEIIELLKHGNHIALISDAGTPLVSDPGYTLVREAIKQGIAIETIPGPSALVAALTISGLPSHHFFFLGYPPEKASHRKKLFTHIQELPESIKKSTYIFYCAPHKLIQTLIDLQESVGDREIVLARELTKAHEEIWRGSISDATIHFAAPKGEFVLLFALP